MMNLDKTRRLLRAIEDLNNNENYYKDFVFESDGSRAYSSTTDAINDLLEDIRRNGALQGIGKPESLKRHPGYSRRIDKENRLVYVIDELRNIKIISCRGHYKDM